MRQSRDRRMKTREFISISTDSESDSDLVSSSSIQVPNSSPLKQEKRGKSEGNSNTARLRSSTRRNLRSHTKEKISGSDSDTFESDEDSIINLDDSDLIDQSIDSSPKKSTKRLSSLTERFGYRGQLQASKNVEKGSGYKKLPGLTREQSVIFSRLCEKFKRIPQSTISHAVRAHSSYEEASRVLGSLPFKALKIRKKPFLASKLKMKPVKAGNFYHSEQKSGRAEKEDVVSSKVVLNDSASIVKRFRGKRVDRNQNGYMIDLDSGKGSVKNTYSRKRRLVRGSDMYEREDGLLDGVVGGSVAQRARLLKRKHVIEIGSDDEALEEELRLREEKRRRRREQYRKREEMKAGEDDIDMDEDEDVDESEDSGMEQLDFTERVMHFLNTADLRNIVDIAGVSPEIAESFIKFRPYSSYDDVENRHIVPVKRNSRKKPIGEKILETTVRKLRGYETVDSLVGKCKAYGDEIKRAVQKWGAKVNGEDGELQIASVGCSDESDVEGEEKAGNASDDISVVSHRLVPKETPELVLSGEESYSDNLDDADYMEGERHEIMTRKKRKPRKKFNFFKRQPRLMSSDCKLKGYQQIGVNWLSLLYDRELSCILADEMGLGKTIQVIAFIAHLKELGSPSPHLIVVPASTLENWLREFEKFAPSLDVRPYYGSQNEREELRMDLEEDQSYDVLVTTYSMATGNKYDQIFLRSRKFNVIVYDEGHMLKNSTSTRYKNLMKLKGQFRVLLTGTPLQNNLRELISLLSFIMPQVFNEKKRELEDLFDQKTKTIDTQQQNLEYGKLNPLLSEQAIKRARTLMTPFVLRRKKAQVMKYLPEKHSHIVYCGMTPAQRAIYDGAVADARYKIREREKRKTMSADQVSKLPRLGSNHYLMTLRKACLHPMLFRYLYTEPVLHVMAKKIMRNSQYLDANEQYIYEDMTVMSDFELNQLCHNFVSELGEYCLPVKFYLHSGKVQKLVEILDGVVSRKEKVLIFSMFTQVLDVLEKVLSFQNIRFVRLDGATSVDERQNIIDKFSDDAQIPVFLLSTKAGGFGINLVAATNVVIYDLSFNPHDDKQAEDRAHRVGQTKDVNVYRLICKDTIEENILKVAYNKLELDTSMMSEGKKVETALIEEIDKALIEKVGDDDKSEEKTEVKTETKNETKNEVKNETKNETKNDVKNEVKNENKNETKNDVQNENKSGDIKKESIKNVNKHEDVKNDDDNRDGAIKEGIPEKKQIKKKSLISNVLGTADDVVVTTNIKDKDYYIEFPLTYDETAKPKLQHIPVSPEKKTDEVENATYDLSSLSDMSDLPVDVDRKSDPDYRD